MISGSNPRVPSSCLMRLSVSLGDGSLWTGSVGMLGSAGGRRGARDEPTLFAAAMVAWREVRSRIMRSFCSCLSACTVCACWRRLSRRENCLPQ